MITDLIRAFYTREDVVTCRVQDNIEGRVDLFCLWMNEDERIFLWSFITPFFFYAMLVYFEFSSTVDKAFGFG